ncbi:MULTISPECIES: hypothetical protein [Blautia]|nr:hypothetical protein [Blautia marasmi]
MGCNDHKQPDADNTWILFHDRWVERAALSDETIEWLTWYNGLSEEEQLSISYLPADLLEECGLTQTEDSEADTCSD